MRKNYLLGRKAYLLGRNYRQKVFGYAMMKLLQKTMKQILFYGPDHGIIKKEYHEEKEEKQIQH